MKRSVVAIVVMFALALAFAPGAAEAQTSCPPDAEARATALRARVDRERSKVKRWRIGWAIGFSALAGGQLALLLTENAPFGDFDEPAKASLEAGTVKAVIGAASRAVGAIKTPRAAVTGDACADLAAAEAAMALAGKTEKKAFWISHVGNIVVHAGGSLYIGLAADDAWDEAAISFGIGYAISLAATYTQPRGAWHMAPMVTPDTRGVSLAWSF